jgi:hypothetical protein
VIRIRATLADGTVYVGPIQGSGGRIGSGALHAGREAAARDAERTLGRVQRRAARGKDTGVYEPEPGHLAIFPEETAEGPGRQVVIPIHGTRFEVEPERKPELVTIWTTAPESYDGFGTETVRIAGHRVNGRRSVREVTTPAVHAEWQRQRYYSGAIYMVADEAEWKKLIDCGLVEVEDRWDALTD